MTTPAALRLVSVTGRGAHVLLWGYTATVALLALTSLDELDSPWPSIGGLVVLLAVAALLTVDTAERMMLSTAIAVAAVWPAITAVANLHLLVPGGFGQWYFGAGVVALFYLSIRGRQAIAWAGFAASSAAMLVWGATTDVGLIGALILVGKQAPILLAGSLFVFGVRRTSATIARISDEMSVRAALTAAQGASADIRRSRLDELDGIATPLLARLAEDRPLSDDERVEFAVTEAALRDSLRGRALAVPVVAAAASQARRRGVQVVLLDDRHPEPPDEERLPEVIAALTSALERAQDGRVVGRLLPPGRPEIATVLVDSSTGQSHDVILA